MELNDAQKAEIARHGRPLHELDANQRLAVANLADLPANKKATAAPTAETAPVAPPKVWRFDTDLGELVETNAEPLAVPLPPEDRPDLDKLASVNAERRSAYADAVNVVKRSKAEAHLPEPSRRVRADELATAEALVGYFARPE